MCSYVIRIVCMTPDSVNLHTWSWMRVVSACRGQGIAGVGRETRKVRPGRLLPGVPFR
jgi:hypothetical protein